MWQASSMHARVRNPATKTRSNGQITTNKRALPHPKPCPSFSTPLPISPPLPNSPLTPFPTQLNSTQPTQPHLPLSPHLQKLGRLVPARAVRRRQVLGIQRLDTGIDGVKEVAGNIQVLGKGQGERHIGAREARLLLGLEGVVRGDVVKVRFDGDAESDVGVVEEGESGIRWLALCLM